MLFDKNYIRDLNGFYYTSVSNLFKNLIERVRNSRVYGRFCTFGNACYLLNDCYFVLEPEMMELRQSLRAFAGVAINPNGILKR